MNFPAGPKQALSTIFAPLAALIFIAATFTASVPCPAQQTVTPQSWPQLHGPTQNGQSEATGLPVEWSETSNIVWKTAIHPDAPDFNADVDELVESAAVPEDVETQDKAADSEGSGEEVATIKPDPRHFGWSSPVIFENQIWLTTARADGREMYAVCLDRATGDVVHDILLFKNGPSTDVLLTNSFASSTPAVEAGRVYIHFGTYGTACLDTANGSIVWQRRDLHCDHLRGPGSSPLLDGDLLYLNYDGADNQFIVALDKRTGKTVWRKERSTDFGNLDGDLRKAYDTPIIIEVDGKRQLVSIGAKSVFAYDPATGEEIWSVRYAGYSNASRPIFDGKLIYLSTGFSKADFWAIRPDGHGDVTDTHVVWRQSRNVSLKPTPLIIDGRIYMPYDKGILSCLDAATGELIWQETPPRRVQRIANLRRRSHLHPQRRRRDVCH